MLKKKKKKKLQLQGPLGDLKLASKIHSSQGAI